MQIIQETLTNTTHTFYNIGANTLTRSINSKVYQVTMRPNTTIDTLDRLTKLDNESFKDLADIQAMKEALK